MIALIPVRFRTNTNASSTWTAGQFFTWMDKAVPYSLAHYWSLSGWDSYDLTYRLHTEMFIDDPRHSKQADPKKTERQNLVDGCLAVATSMYRDDWSRFDIAMLWFAQGTDAFGGGTAAVPLPNGGTKNIPVTVVDIDTPFDMVCEELGHSLGLAHELGPNGEEYGCPYSAMSARRCYESVRPADTRLPDGNPDTNPDSPYFRAVPAQRIVGPVLPAAQLYRYDWFRSSGRVSQGHPQVRYAAPQIQRVHALDWARQRPAEHWPVLVTVPGAWDPAGPGAFGAPVLYGIELRRSTEMYATGITSGLVVHALNRNGRVWYQGVAPTSLFVAQADWACLPAGFTITYSGVGPNEEFVDFQIHVGTTLSFPIRGVLLLGGFRTYAELNGMSHDDMRNTLIVELTNRSAQHDYQAYDNETLAGMGAVLVALRRLGIRDDTTLKGLTADDQRNILIVELDAQTGAGQRLQGFTNLQLIQILLGSSLATRGIDLTAVDHVTRGVLLVGGFRNQHELNSMSWDDMRNTLIVELTNHSNQTNYQAYSDTDLAGAGAVMVALRELHARDDATLKTMSSDDQRNTLIVVLDAQTGLGQKLQGFTNVELAFVALGIEKAVP